ncbi:MAG: hypothetical protein GXX84_13965 [Acidobacteria bacterium]|nr:hypothetical protein [Acidobacteriota bacterium]
MRCDEVQEHIVGLLYNEGSVPPEAVEHIHACPDCRGELENLRQTRNHLQLWKEEQPGARVLIFNRERSRGSSGLRKHLRYAAVAAMALICLLAFANTRITWNKDGFSFSTHLFSRPAETERNYYTKAELRDIMKRALDDTEFRINETNYLMIQRMIETVEQDRWADLNFVRSSAVRNQNVN